MVNTILLVLVEQSDSVIYIDTFYSFSNYFLARLLQNIEEFVSYKGPLSLFVLNVEVCTHQSQNSELHIFLNRYMAFYL